MVKDILKIASKNIQKLLHRVYHEALEKEFQIQNIPFKKQVKLELFYENQKLKKQYRADFVCYDTIILEIKAVSQMPVVFNAQLKRAITNFDTQQNDSWRTCLPAGRLHLYQQKITYKQMKNYLKCTKMELGMLINFGTPSLTYKRILNTPNSQ